MNKPFTLKIEELKSKIVEDINDAGLPAYCVKIILQGIFNQIETLDNKEIENYNKEIEQKEEK